MARARAHAHAPPASACERLFQPPGAHVCWKQQLQFHAVRHVARHSCQHSVVAGRQRRLPAVCWTALPRPPATPDGIKSARRFCYCDLGARCCHRAWSAGTTVRQPGGKQRSAPAVHPSSLRERPEPLKCHLRSPAKRHGRQEPQLAAEGCQGSRWQLYVAVLRMRVLLQFRANELDTRYRGRCRRATRPHMLLLAQRQPRDGRRRMLRRQRPHRSRRAAAADQLVRKAMVTVLP